MKYIRLVTVVAALTVILTSGFYSNVAQAFDINNPTGSNSSNVCPKGSTQTYCGETAGGGTNKISGSNGYIIVTTNILSLAGGVAAVIMIIVGSIMLTASGGDPNSVKSAKNMVIYALVGILVIAVAQLIVRVVLGQLG